MTDQPEQQGGPELLAQVVRWIPVSERLPSESRWVLVARKVPSKVKTPDDYVCEACFDPPDIWSDGDGVTHRDITHWAERPMHPMSLAGIATPEEFVRKAKEPFGGESVYDIYMSGRLDVGSVAIPALMAAYVRGHQCDLGEQCPGCMAGYALERITGRKWTQEECEASVSPTEQGKEALNGR